MHLFLGFISLAAGAEQLVDLAEIYKQSLSSDPTFRKAYATYLSTKELVPIAWSSLLPSVNATGAYSRMMTSTDTFVGGTATADYYQQTYSLKASQPIFNLSAWNGVLKANDSVKAAQATFNASAQALMLNVSSTYFAVLFAEDTLTYSKAKKRANFRQYEQAEQRFKVGLDAITSVYEAKAAYDSSRASVISANNNLVNQKENLRKLTFKEYEHIAPLKPGDIPLVTPKPEDVEVWVQTALRQNYKLIAAKYAAKAAKKNIDVNAANHLPTVSLVGSYSDQKTNSDVVFVDIDSINASASISANVPLFQGGLVVAQTRQAIHDYESSYATMDNTYRDTIVNVHTAYNSITDGISKIKADRQAVISATQSLDSTEAQFKVGTRTMVDVVNAQERLFLAQKDLARDRYDYINSILKLKSYAGTLSPNDIADINTWLKGKVPHKTTTNSLLLNAPIKGITLTKTKLSKKIPKTAQKR